MECSQIGLVTACTLALPLLDAGASAQSGGVWTTPANQILVELAHEDTAAGNLFDLDGRSLVFTPDGDGGYSRAVRPLAWEEPIGPLVSDGDEIALGFGFDFGGRRWTSFHVSRHGLLTFGAPLAYNYTEIQNRFNTMREIAGKFADVPTISTLFKPLFGGSPLFGNDYLASQHVAHRSDRVVVTWFAADVFRYDPGGIRPTTADNRYQAVLHADGRIAFNYQKIAVGDGIVGLFDAQITKGRLIATIADRTDPDLPGHLDLLDAAVYATNADSKVILEFTLRDPIPEPGAGEVYSYRLHFDTDKPYWDHPLEWSDNDVTWQIEVRSGGEYVSLGDGVLRLLAGGGGNTRISLLADAAVLGGGDGRRISAMIIAGAHHFIDDQWIQGENSSREMIELNLGTPGVDLSQPDGGFSERQSEIFHYRGPPNLTDVSCRVLNALGGGYDLFIFHSEFRVDGNQEGASQWRSYEDDATGTGRSWNRDSRPCGGNKRLRGHYTRPVWMPYLNEGDFDAELTLFGHEFIHTWAAYLSYERDGRHEPLTDTNCACHWRVGLHTPAAFPWRGGDAMSIMSDWGGGFWRDNGDGTFTPVARYYAGGPSWLDLYVMGLAAEWEVPDMFLLRNLRRIDDGRFAGDKETISIQQIVAASGPRIPTVATSQKVFNAGFVYLLDPGTNPSPALLRLHAAYRDRVIEYWSHTTGGRSQITSNVPSSNDE